MWLQTNERDYISYKILMIGYNNVGTSNILNNNRGYINYKREGIGLLDILSLTCMP